MWTAITNLFLIADEAFRSLLVYITVILWHLEKESHRIDYETKCYHASNDRQGAEPLMSTEATSLCKQHFNDLLLRVCLSPLNFDQCRILYVLNYGSIITTYGILRCR